MAEQTSKGEAREMTITVSLCRPTQTILDELKHPEIKQRSVALTYALAIRSHGETDWEKVNQAIITRWSRAGLERIKKMAWKIVRG